MIRTAAELAAAAETVATQYDTLYVLGCIGAALSEKNKGGYFTRWAYNKRWDRARKIKAATRDTFGFDCVCLFKSLLWGWNGNKDASYGGASYCANGVPDLDANAMIGVCQDVSTDFSHIEVGEALWIKDHFGLYLGGGRAVECTPRWADGVQITAVHNISSIPGLHGRTWTKHGKLPYVEYTAAEAPVEPQAPEVPGPGKSNREIAKEVLAGAWGSGATRKKRLTAAGYNYSAVQAEVNRILKHPKPARPTELKCVEDVAREVIQGKWGSGAARRKRLTDAGYFYEEVQAEVNRILKGG